MTTIATNHPIQIEIIDDAAIITRLCSVDQSYALACAATDINAESDFPYDVIRFDKRLRMHTTLPGASEARKNDVVFTSAIPLGLLRRFCEKSGLVSVRQ
ncbi:MAG: hypothetical protein ACRECY_07280 [Phyllobacterium sp.]